MDYENSQNMANLLYQCHALELTHQLDEIVDKILAEARKIEIELFESVYLPSMPSLKTLVGQLQAQKISVENPPFPKVFQLILATYIIRCVQEEPSKNWTLAPVGCKCQHCVPLNAFLVDPLEVRRFPVNKKWHLLNVIPRDLGFIADIIDKGKPTETLRIMKTKE